MTDLNMRTNEPTFDLIWYIVVLVLAIIFIYLKISKGFTFASLIKSKTKDRPVDLKTIASNMDAKIIQVTLNQKVTYVYSDSKHSFQLDFDKFIQKQSEALQNEYTNIENLGDGGESND